MINEFCLEGSVLTDLCQGGVFALVNPFSKRIYINYSNNMLSYISRLLTDVKDGIYPLKQLNGDATVLKVRILEVRDDIETLDYWFSKYIEDGWTIYNAGLKRPQIRKPRVVISSLNDSRVEARLYNKRNDYEVVGVFDNVPEADAFIETSYGEYNPFCYRVFAANFLTRKELT